MVHNYAINTKFGLLKQAIDRVVLQTKTPLRERGRGNPRLSIFDRKIYFQPTRRKMDESLGHAFERKDTRATRLPLTPAYGNFGINLGVVTRINFRGGKGSACRGCRP